MVGSVGLIVAVLIYVRWKARINQGLAIASMWVGRIVKDPKTCKVAETFFIESAVLWFVFPLVDSLYDQKKVDPKLQHSAYAVAAVFFVFAVLLSHAAGKED